MIENKKNNYVAITKSGEEILQTFVVDGAMTLDALFELIDSKPGTLAQISGSMISKISIHRDETVMPHPLELSDTLGRNNVSQPELKTSF